MVKLKSICLCQNDTCKSTLIFIHKYKYPLQKVCFLNLWYVTPRISICVSMCYVSVQISLITRKKQEYVTPMEVVCGENGRLERHFINSE